MVHPLRLIVNLVVMVMKGYSIYLKAPEQQPRYRLLFSVTPRTPLFCLSYFSAETAVFCAYPTGSEENVKRNSNFYVELTKENMIFRGANVFKASYIFTQYETFDHTLSINHKLGTSCILADL